MVEKKKLPILFYFLTGLLFVGVLVELQREVINRNYFGVLFILVLIVFLQAFYQRQTWGWFGILVWFGFNLIQSIIIGIIHLKQSIILIAGVLLNVLFLFVFTRKSVEEWVFEGKQQQLKLNQVFYKRFFIVVFIGVFSLVLIKLFLLVKKREVKSVKVSNQVESTTVIDNNRIIPVSRYGGHGDYEPPFLVETRESLNEREKYLNAFKEEGKITDQVYQSAINNNQVK